MWKIIAIDVAIILILIQPRKRSQLDGLGLADHSSRLVGTITDYELSVPAVPYIKFSMFNVLLFCSSKT